MRWEKMNPFVGVGSPSDGVPIIRRIRQINWSLLVCLIKSIKLILSRGQENQQRRYFIDINLNLRRSWEMRVKVGDSKSNTGRTQ